MAHSVHEVQVLLVQYGSIVSHKIELIGIRNTIEMMEVSSDAVDFLLRLFNAKCLPTVRFKYGKNAFERLNGKPP